MTFHAFYFVKFSSINSHICVVLTRLVSTKLVVVTVVTSKFWFNFFLSVIFSAHAPKTFRGIMWGAPKSHWAIAWRHAWRGTHGLLHTTEVTVTPEEETKNCQKSNVVHTALHSKSVWSGFLQPATFRHTWNMGQVHESAPRVFLQSLHSAHDCNWFPQKKIEWLQGYPICINKIEKSASFLAERFLQTVIPNEFK